MLYQLYAKYKTIVNYLIVGCLTTVVNLAVYYGCVLTVLDPSAALELQAANVLSWVAAVAFAYYTNRRFVFESRNANIGREACAFVASRLGTLVLDMLFMYLLVTCFAVNDKIAKLLVQGVVIVANYLLSRLLVFKR